jgi:hypothetical protein
MLSGRQRWPSSASLGFRLPLLGLFWDLTASRLIYMIFGGGMLNLFMWISSYIISVLLTAVIEAACLIAVFKIPFNAKRWWLWAGANTASVSLAYLSFFVRPISAHDQFHIWLF